MNGLMLYDKNVTMFLDDAPRGLCPRILSRFLLRNRRKWLSYAGKTMLLEDAPMAYEDFEARKMHKIVFKMGGEKAGESVEEKVK
jgi:hypothetical protein